MYTAPCDPPCRRKQCVAEEISETEYQSQCECQETPKCGTCVTPCE